MIKHFYFSLMKTVYFFLSLFFSTHCFSQSTEDPVSEMRRLSPFKENGRIVGCPRDWMMPRERMDSLKQEVKRLEAQFETSPDTPVDLNSASFIKLFESEYEVKIEAWGQVNELFCVSDSERGSLLTKVQGSPLTLEPVKCYGNYLVIKRESYYLGNCQKLTTVKEYYIRKD